jgi:hypothetical protein
MLNVANFYSYITRTYIQLEVFAYFIIICNISNQQIQYNAFSFCILFRSLNFKLKNLLFSINSSPMSQTEALIYYTYSLSHVKSCANKIITKMSMRHIYSYETPILHTSNIPLTTF